LEISDLRRYAVARSLFEATTLKRALDRFGFVQADPIRAPARAQDLILRHRVNGYRAGDLERRYASLDIHEDFFINYGFVTSAVQELMHPRGREARWGGRTRSGQRMRALLEFVRTRGTVHPREVDEHFSHGTVTNYWGGSSSATTHLLDAMHYRGLLRVVRRERGIRIYAAHEHTAVARDAPTRRAHLDALVDLAVSIYAPVPGATLSWLVRRLQYAVPQWQSDLTRTLQRAKQRLSHARADGVDWYFPAGDDPRQTPAPSDSVRLLAPFDPIVWDRRRFEILWGWAYRFEAYTPQAKRKMGYYALPLLWRDRVVGWGNLAVKDGALRADFGYVGSPPASRVFRRALDEDLDRMRVFLAIAD
jgi:uncharacterized protein